jgi:hypothetical protein
MPISAVVDMLMVFFLFERGQVCEWAWPRKLWANHADCEKLCAHNCRFSKNL